MPDKLYSLRDVAEDLWGAAPVQAQPAQAPAPEQPMYRSAFPPFEQLWKTADDTVDWTDALASDKPTDALTSQHLWSFFHSHAEAVLHGDAAAYVEVLQAAHPLGDLSPYAAGFDVECISADMLAARFTALPAYMDKPEAEARRYLCGMALRIARDLMALLPVRQVSVTALHGETAPLTVTFQRSELQKVRFSFIDPVAFVTDQGATFA